MYNYLVLSTKWRMLYVVYFIKQVLRPRYSSYVMVWESSTNKAGLVDVDTGSVRKGVELLPLRNKIFSGWYDHVAVRRLTGISDAKRDQIYDKLLEVRDRQFSTHKHPMFHYCRYEMSFRESLMRKAIWN